MMNVLENPCAHCRRLNEPENCENKECLQWRSWFIGWWDAMRAQYLSRVTDPCETCMCSKQQCAEPCVQRKMWEGQR